MQKQFVIFFFLAGLVMTLLTSACKHSTGKDGSTAVRAVMNPNGMLVNIQDPQLAKLLYQAMTKTLETKDRDSDHIVRQGERIDCNLIQHPKTSIKDASIEYYCDIYQISGKRILVENHIAAAIYRIMGEAAKSSHTMGEIYHGNQIKCWIDTQNHGYHCQIQLTHSNEQRN